MGVGSYREAGVSPAGALSHLRPFPLYPGEAWPTSDRRLTHGFAFLRETPANALGATAGGGGFEHGRRSLLL